MDLQDTKQQIDIPHEDSGTESYTESPVAEEESEQSEDSTICDTDIKSNTCKTRHLQHILDKSFSVDEEVLDVPLCPVKFSNSTNGENNESGIDLTTPPDSTENHLCSILRRGSCFENKSNTSLDSFQLSLSSRKVSFPREEAELAIYRYSESDNGQCISEILNPEAILSAYEKSCKLHQTIELDVIKNQISDIKNNTNHSASLNLSAINVTIDVNETFEDLFKLVNFRTIVLSDCKFTSDTISEFLNMLEYYDSTREIEVAMKFDDESWRSFCSACSNIRTLDSIVFKSMTIKDDLMRSLLHSVRNNSNITILKFDSCILEKLPSFYLVDSLMTNTTLRELYLPSTGLYTKEADCLGRFLQRNSHLKVLDISNNFIGDRGFEVLAKGLMKQNDIGTGLSVLVVFNNQLTEKSGAIMNNTIKSCKNLHTLNVGYNNLTDEALCEMKEGLEVTTSLEGLGLQCTLLTCKGIISLAEAIEENTTLLKINLKGNKAIQIAGLDKLCHALTNSKIIKIEIDETNRSCHDPAAYLEMVKKLRAICTVNKSFRNTKEEEISNISLLVSRKVSLSCEPRFHVPEVTQPVVPQFNRKPLTVPSPSSSPASRSRFQITRVPDTSPRPFSRFKVTPVFMPSPEEDDGRCRFANARSSVSSNDSVDSLMAHPDLLDTDSE